MFCLACSCISYTLGAIALLITLLLALKIYIKLTIAWANCYTCLLGKTAIVTGANKGIGYWTALDFAKRGARVILACRDLARAEEAKKKIVQKSGNDNVHVKLLDLCSFKSVRKFCKEINETEQRIDVLVNNAGVGRVDGETEDGNLIPMQANHLSHFLMTHLLIGKLKKSAPSRVVAVASLAAKGAKLSSEPVTHLHSTTWLNLKSKSLYRNTKQANILFARVLGERLKGTGVTAYSLHPGIIYTDIFLPENFSKFTHCMFRRLFLTPQEGAQTTIYCAVNKEIENETGLFYDNCKRCDFYKSCDDMALAEEIWKSSEELTKLGEHEKMLPIKKTE